MPAISNFCKMILDQRRSLSKCFKNSTITFFILESLTSGNFSPTLDIIDFSVTPLNLGGIILSILFSCSPGGILASGGATTMVVAEGDRSLGTVVDDATIKVNIAAKFINSDDNLFVDVGTNVLEGRVLLTGLVDNQEIRIDAVRRVCEVDGEIST